MAALQSSRAAGLEVDIEAHKAGENIRISITWSYRGVFDHASEQLLVPKTAVHTLISLSELALASIQRPIVDLEVPISMFQDYGWLLVAISPLSSRTEFIVDILDREAGEVFGYDEIVVHAESLTRFGEQLRAVAEDL